MLKGNITVQGLHAKERGALCLGQGGKKEVDFPFCP